MCREDKKRRVFFLYECELEMLHQPQLQACRQPQGAPRGSHSSVACPHPSASGSRCSAGGTRCSGRRRRTSRRRQHRYVTGPGACALQPLMNNSRKMHQLQTAKCSHELEGTTGLQCQPILPKTPEWKLAPLQDFECQDQAGPVLQWRQMSPETPEERWAPLEDIMNIFMSSPLKAPQDKDLTPASLRKPRHYRSPVVKDEVQVVLFEADEVPQKDEHSLDDLTGETLLVKFQTLLDEMTCESAVCIEEESGESPSRLTGEFLLVKFQSLLDELSGGGTACMEKLFAVSESVSGA